MNPTALNEALADRYVVEREIGRGGMATVFLARDLRHDRLVALKVLESGARRRPRRRALPERDPRHREPAASRTCCRCSIRARPTGMLFYVMPFVEGESLRARLDREKQLPVDEAVRIAHRDRGTRSTTRTPTASSIATSSPRTFCSSTARPSSPTSASRSPSATPAEAASRRPASRSARRSTCRPSRRPATARSTAAATSIRSARCSTRCSPASRRTSAAPGRRSSRS